MKPHKHAELIKAWADGAEIEIRTQYTDDGSWSSWEKFENPRWDISYGEYRIKPKPDVVRYTQAFMTSSGTWGKPSEFDNLRLIFDGETGELKSAEVLK